MILPLTSPAADLATAGGKGANLARLARAGFAVPPGFLVTTAAYRAFVVANHLEPAITDALAGLTPDDAPALDRASTAIRAAFAAGAIPATLTARLRAAYVDLGQGPVAVRSSATAEDLPDLSFAGQQDTYLNVLGATPLLDAVRACWGSLWTARAIGYRARHAIPHADAALAVVVQRMIPADVAGVLFTANPLTGNRFEFVVDASFGLGEALVSGQVEPDQFVLDAASGAVLRHTPGAKAVVTRPLPGGGVETVPADPPDLPTLTPADLHNLAAAGRAIQDAFGAPQDVEWALASGALHILQSRPITSLFPVPEIARDPLAVWVSFGAVQGVVGPMTPLGRDAIGSIMAGLSGSLGAPTPLEALRAIVSAGERLWIRVSDMIRHPIGRRLFDASFDLIEPGSAAILRVLAAEPRLGAGSGRLRLRTLWRAARYFFPIVARTLRVALRPARARARLDAAIASNLAAAAIPPGADRYERLAGVAAFLRQDLADAFPFLLPRFIPLMAPGMAGLNLLSRMAGETALALEVTRGLPDNVTTEMDLALWETARTIAADPPSRDAFATLDAAHLADDHHHGDLPPVAQTAVAGFLDAYGMRGVGEIDLGQPRWREDPTPIMRTLQSYLRIDPASAPDALFRRGAAAAGGAVDTIAARVRRRPGGRARERLVRAAARRVRLLAGARESPKFYMVRLFGLARRALLAVGAEFVAAGILDRPDDLTFLHLAELEALARAGDNPSADWQGLVAARRAAYEREARRRRVPRVLAGDGRAFYEAGHAAEANANDALIQGSPVSPGVVEGIVRVVFDPRAAQLAPDEILVCPGTDPAWTPLFMAAGGLVTEVGGLMTHGSVVARELGIPAVVGVHRATSRLHDGQRIRLDGSTGEIALLAPKVDAERE